jgi:hypothetical protein
MSLLAELTGPMELSKLLHHLVMSLQKQVAFDISVAAQQQQRCKVLFSDDEINGCLHSSAKFSSASGNEAMDTIKLMNPTPQNMSEKEIILKIT